MRKDYKLLIHKGRGVGSGGGVSRPHRECERAKERECVRERERTKKRWSKTYMRREIGGGGGGGGSG